MSTVLGSSAMSRLCVIAALVSLSACRIALEDPVEYSARTCSEGTVPACVEAAQHSDLTWIEQNVFPNCTFSGCHDGRNTDDASMMDLREGHAHASLVGVDSKIATGAGLTGKAKLVTPMVPNQSYLLVMLRALTPEQHDPPLDAPPKDIGFMPQNAGGVVTCCQKLDALTRWIEEGAQDN